MSKNIFFVENMPSSNLVCRVADGPMSSTEEEENVPLLGAEELQDNDKKEIISRKASSVSSSSSRSFQQGDAHDIPYPKCVFFILSTEACERFSYYGMRAILSLYLKSLFLEDGMEQKAAEDLATALYHAFIFLSYFTSLFGAFLADSFLGKFRTIFYISIVYAIGQIVLSIGAIPATEDGLPNNPQMAISFTGLILIGFGTGGIKPCVVSFGADQFVIPQQRPEMTTFFGIFYGAINFGSMISTILTPIFRKQSCFGEDDCYSLAFGVPAVLMIVAIVFFVLGRPGYKITIPDRNIVAETFSAIWEAIKMKRKSKDKLPHWMDYATPRFGKRFVADIKAVLKISVIFCLYPVFWALYDQQGSRWTFQATRMDGEIGSVMVLPDQMQVINAALILIYIPIFDKGVYPLLTKFGLLTKPLQRIVTGGMLLASSFVISGIVELVLEDTYSHPPGKVHKNEYSTRLGIHNAMPTDCLLDLNVYRLPIGDGERTTIYKDIEVPVGMTYVSENDKGWDLLPFNVEEHGFANLTIEGTVKNTQGGDCPAPYIDMPVSSDIVIPYEESRTLMIYPDFDKTTTDTADLYFKQKVLTYSDEASKPSSGYPYMRFVYDVPDILGSFIVVNNKNYDVTKPDKKKGKAFEKEIDFASFGDCEISPVAREEGDLGEYQTLPTGVDCSSGEMPFAEEMQKNGVFRVCLRNWVHAPPGELACAERRGITWQDKEGKAETDIQYHDYRYGGSYQVYLRASQSVDGEVPVLTIDIEEVASPNSMHMMWLLPQYFVLTAGEVLFSITSLHFSFTQAPESMKAVVQALYLLTNAIGNLIDLFAVAALASVWKSQADEFFFFAGMMVLDMLILAWMATKYTYVDYTAGDPHAHLFADEENENEMEMGADRLEMEDRRSQKSIEDKMDF